MPDTGQQGPELQALVEKIMEYARESKDLLADGKTPEEIRQSYWYFLHRVVEFESETAIPGKPLAEKEMARHKDVERLFGVARTRILDMYIEEFAKGMREYKDAQIAHLEETREAVKKARIDADKASKWNYVVIAATVVMAVASILQSCQKT